jgi:hypothetical protein
MALERWLYLLNLLLSLPSMLRLLLQPNAPA